MCLTLFDFLQKIAPKVCDHYLGFRVPKVYLSLKICGYFLVVSCFVTPNKSQDKIFSTPAPQARFTNRILQQKNTIVYLLKLKGIERSLNRSSNFYF